MNKNKIVGYWLLIGVAMLIVQVLLGGITRLTGSGLSITEWKPILGIIPPMNETEWQRVFLLYQEKTGQFKFLNPDFSLSDFKFIYFWEWLHRNWARFISVVFLIPFFWFLYKKYFTQAMISKLIALFLLGAAQGLIGWIMVKSGLNDDNLYVSHIRLAIHFVSALVLIAFTLWFALTLLIPDSNRIYHKPTLYFTWSIILLSGVQLIYGAFMAGLKAATAAPTWPDINGDFIPDSIWHQSFVYDSINIHFVHRTLAYLLLILIVIWYLKIRGLKGPVMLNRMAGSTFILIVLQAILGICTVLFSTHTTRNGFGTFEYLAQAHQLVAMFLVMSLISVWFLVKGNMKGVKG